MSEQPNARVALDITVFLYLLWEHYTTLSQEMAGMRAHVHVLDENMPQNEPGSPGQPKCPTIRESTTVVGLAVNGVRILVMSSVDPAHTLSSGRHAIGTSGRHPSERVDGVLRNRWSAWAGLCTEVAPTPSICSAGVLQQYLEGVHFTLHPSLWG